MRYYAIRTLNDGTFLEHEAVKTFDYDKMETVSEERFFTNKKTGTAFIRSLAKKQHAANDLHNQHDNDLFFLVTEDVLSKIESKEITEIHRNTPGVIAIATNLETIVL